MNNLLFHGDIPAEPGTYALLLAADTRARLQVGRLGPMEVEPGWYLYVGSAFGPGGLRARLAHHAKKAAKPHWHIDYLRLRTQLAEVWWLADSRRLEEQWVESVLSIRGARLPVPGFGASDSQQLSHLIWFRLKPGARTFFRRLQQSDPLHPKVRVTRA